MGQPTSAEPWSDAKRAAYLRSVRERVAGLPMLYDAALKGTIADPYALPHEVRRAVAELDAVLKSYDPDPA